ncbi:MAG: 2-oxo acid dehydrogenase subunit E2 [Firmicutes bacterium]|nr:2-oxo acid dehydrogenase subunit E2 [Bacillota bacterium]
MPLEFCLPAVADAEAEGFVVNWFKDEGQPVKQGELLLEVQFEKVTTEIYAPQDGVLVKILAPQGTPIKVGQPLCLIATPEEAAQLAGEGRPEPAAAQAPGPAQGGSAGSREVRATPAAKRLARELGINIADVPGTGPGGRIGEEDVKRYAEALKRRQSEQRESSSTGQAAAAAPTAPEVPATGQATAASRPETVVPGTSRVTAGGRREPLSPAQRVTGQLMLTSLRETAQYTLGREIEVTALVALRARARQMGSPVTLTDLIHRAVILALGKHPRMQAQLDGDELVVPNGVNLGFAVARGEELLVPVIKEAQNLSLPELAAERQRLTEAVKAGKVSPLDLQGATFTVSNLGTFGIDFFTPVLNPPQPAILGVGRVVERLVMAGRTIQPAQFITFSLTVDHRIINGANGAEFLQTLAELLAAPEGWAFVG